MYCPPFPFWSILRPSLYNSLGFRSDQVSLLCDAQRQIASHCEVCKKNQEKTFLDSAKLQDEVRILRKGVSRTLTVKFDFFFEARSAKVLEIYLIRIMHPLNRHVLHVFESLIFVCTPKMKLIKKSREQDLNQIQQTLRALHTETTQCGKVFVLHPTG
jgi:hypothetical protein